MGYSSAPYKRRKREEARLHDRCIVCCIRPVPLTRRTCDPCNAAAKAHVSRMRERQKEQRKHALLAHGYEATGDAAMERFAYADACTQFERALAQNRTVEDEVRLCEKIGLAVANSARPDFATPWFERALERCLTTTSLSEKAPRLLGNLARQYWLESRTKDAFACTEQARKLAASASIEQEEKEALIYRIDAGTANQLVLLGHYDEAARLVAEREPGGKNQLARATYLDQRAIIYATKGQATEAFADFDVAVELGKADADGYNTTVQWDDYANWAMALGRIDIARTCRESALLVARERRIAWRIPYLTLRFASMLITMGDYGHARDLVADAMTYDTETPTLSVLKASVAVELAHTIGDNELLKRTLDDEVLEYAFRSGEPERIGPIVSAYAKVAITRGQIPRAKKLIARGVAAVNQADHVGDLLVLAGRYGSLADSARAQSLLMGRTRLPHHRVAQAYLELWEAQRALRSRTGSTAKEHAERAARSFARLRWRHQQAEALALAGKPGTLERDDPAQRRAILSELNPTLTSREQQVAELVLRGLTNRAIAQALSISEHTVETHMTSILNRLGLRSRWQLIGFSNS